MTTETSPIFFEDRLTILLPLATPSVPDWLMDKATLLWLEQKAEYHFTIVGRKTGDYIRKILNNLSQTEAIEKMNHIRSLVQNYDWHFHGTGEYYIIEQSYQNIDTLEWDETRRSIVEVCHFDDLLEFYQELNTLLGTDFPQPFWHITLFSSSTKPEKIQRWIGIYSLEDWNALHPKILTP